ncbi:hypothetical protein VTI28DRAFT_6692 [Corynascus sepedonium]
MLWFLDSRCKRLPHVDAPAAGGIYPVAPCHRGASAPRLFVTLLSMARPLALVRAALAQPAAYPTLTHMYATGASTPQDSQLV